MTLWSSLFGLMHVARNFSWYERCLPLFAGHRGQVYMCAGSKPAHFLVTKLAEMHLPRQSQLDLLSSVT